jgi:hypothetical protein
MFDVRMRGVRRCERDPGGANKEAEKLRGER